MRVEDFVKIIGAQYFAGVPDSLLASLSAYLIDNYGIDGKHHLIAANEGNAVGLAAGYHLATGNVPVVYMQNSGEGNALNPIASLISEMVYKIPMVFVIGWRGEPGIQDEPQHVFQGKITKKLMDLLEIESHVVTTSSTEAELEHVMARFRGLLEKGESVAFLIEKGALVYSIERRYKNNYSINREEAIQRIAENAGNDFIVSTTGKISRELYEFRVNHGQTHDNDFLTVGSMGHASSIAYGIAATRPEKRIWCIDGDGAVLMHMGSMAVIGANKLDNFVHIVLNNAAHESVGGMPTVANMINFSAIAKACGYETVYSVDKFSDLNQVLAAICNQKGMIFVEVKCAIGSRRNLGRPSESPLENKIQFMRSIQD